MLRRWLLLVLQLLRLWVVSYVQSHSVSRNILLLSALTTRESNSGIHLGQCIIGHAAANVVRYNSTIVCN